MKNVVVDFESYYDNEISVKTQGNVNYTQSADAYIVAVTVGNEVLCGTISELAEVCSNMAKDPNLVFWAANSNFDRSWWRKYYPATVQDDWKCLLDLGAYHQMPRNLAGLSKAAQGIIVDKGLRDQMKGVHYEDLPEEAGSGFSKKGIQLYCVEDVQREKELIDFLPPMSSLEEKVASHTRLVNRRGVRVNRELVEHDKNLLEQMKFEAFKAIPWHNDSKPLSYSSLQYWCRLNGIPVPKSTAKRDEECASLMSAHPVLNEILGSMRRFRKANTLLEKISTLNARTTEEEDILPLDILYCGAPHTRRWSSKGFNIQNLDKKPTIATDDGGTIWTRNWIIPPPGKMFLVLDFSQVEPRCLNWLVGNTDMMEALRHGFSYYEAYAHFARGWRGTPGTIRKEYGVQKYTLLKNECLGLGYGMGVDRFLSYAAESGNSITKDDAKSVVNGFRARNPKIIQFWHKLDNLIISAARDGSKQLEMVMPTGDLLKYFSIRSRRGGGYEGYTVKGDFSGNNKQFNLWGGTLTENVTQRMARDILAESVIRLEEAGFPVAFHAHDEVILVVDTPADDYETRKIQCEAEGIMKQAPEWCPDLPLGVDGNFCSCYTKF